jgi:hypothetical protein
LPKDSLHCAKCGATYGEANRCPHCRAVSDIDPHARLFARCRVCGGPRVPTDDPAVVRSGREIPVLERAKRIGRQAVSFRVAAAVVFAFGVLSLLVALGVSAVVSPGRAGVAGMFVMLAVPFAFAWFARSRSKDADRRAFEELDEAWKLVAADVLSSKGRELAAADLARIMRTNEAHAQRLLDALNVTDFVHARVTEDGELVYSSDAPALGEGALEPLDGQAGVPASKAAENERMPPR